MVVVKCDYCGKELNRFPCDIGKKWNFCNKECEKNYRKGKELKNKKHNIIEIKKDYAIIHIENNIKGHLECLIDIEDINKIKDYYWNIRYDKRHPNCTIYVETHKLKKRIHLHRLIMDAKCGYVIDHIDGDGLNNRKENLRQITQSQNTKNRHSSNILGVYYNKRDKYWSVQLGSKVYGRYLNKRDAIQRRLYLNSLIDTNKWQELETLQCETLTLQKSYQLQNNS